MSCQLPPPAGEIGQMRRIACVWAEPSELHGNSSEMARVWISCTERGRIRQSMGSTDASRLWGCDCDWGVHGACRNTGN
ncbi:protein of unknown function [Streptomyces sp. KY75]|nr:protein of unknown function [Streptomyces sp. KY70]CAD5988206.1 protein of unknown function [Streptomyces sp. KY75]